MVDLAERGRPTLVTTGASRSFRGSVRAVGADFAVVREDRLGDVVIPFRALSSVRPAPGEAGAGDGRPFTVELVLCEMLIELATEHPAIIVLAGRDEFRGRLRSVGIDVMSIVVEGPRRDVVHVNVVAVDHLVILTR